MSELRKNRVIIGTAISIAAIATAIDHTKHRLPAPLKVEKPVQQENAVSKPVTQAPADSSPCSIDSPCGMGVSPCSMD